MTITELISSDDIELVSYNGITETAPAFLNTYRSFKNNVEYADGNYVFKFIGEDLTVTDFDVSKDDYEIGDVVWDNNILNYVSENQTGTVAKQPEDCTNDASIRPIDWTKRYAKIGDFFENNTMVITNGNFVYTFTKNENDIKTEIVEQNIVSAEEYVKEESSCNYLKYTPEDVGAGITESLKWVVGKCDFSFNVNFGGDFQVDTYYTVDGMDNVLVKAVTNMGDNSYSLIKKTSEVRTSNTITALISTSLTTTEVVAEVTNDNVFIPHTYILRGTELYLRTDVDVIQETISITEPQIEILNHVYDVDWGWSKYRPTAPYAPFDNENATIIESATEVKFVLKSKKSFNAVGFSNLIALNVIVGVDGKPELTQEKIPRCVNVIGGKEDISQVDDIIYLLEDVSASTEVTVTIAPLNGRLQLGEGVLGNSKLIGRTELDFKNDTKDLTPMEVDRWGRVVRGVEIKQKVFSGRVVTIEKEYGGITSFLSKVTNHLVFVDGADEADIEVTKNYISAVRVLGRFNASEHAMITIANEVSHGTYSFRVEGLT